MADYLNQLNAMRVLVAESDPDEMARLASILTDAGYYVHKAYNVGDAIAILQQQPVALAVINAGLTNNHQQRLTDHMARFGLVPWIALVDDNPKLERHLIGQGARVCIQTPVAASDLLRQVWQMAHDSTRDALLDIDRPFEQVAPSPGEAENTSALLKRRLIEQQTLSTLARSLSAQLDLDVLLTQIVEAAVRLCDAEEGLLLLPDENEDALYIRAVKGIDSETARNFRIRTQDTLAGQVYRTGKPILLGDQEGLHKLKTEYLVRSLLYVPLSVKGQPIGVLGINNRKANRNFGLHESELLQDLAAHAAVAIENARLYKESVLRTRELSTLVQAADAANSTLALDRVLSIIAKQLIGALNVAQCYITEWHPEKRELRPLAIRYRALWAANSGPAWSPRHKAALDRMLSTRQPVVTIPQESTHPDDLEAWTPHHHFAKSILHVPLYTQEQLLGVATLYRLHAPYPEQGVPQAAIPTLQQLALQLIVLLVGADASRQRKNLFRYAQEMLAAAGADWCEIAVRDAAQEQFNVALSYGEIIWQGEAYPHLDLGRLPHTAMLLDRAQVARTNDSAEIERLCEASAGRSLLALPLTIKEQTAGLVFLVDTLQHRTFPRREIELAQALVSQAANALDNARLYRDLALSLEELHRAQSKLVQTARLSAMGELAAAVAHQINNPLTTILGDAELLLKDVAEDDPDREALTAIFRAGKRAHEVVRRLLAMARQHSVDETPQPLDVNVTVQNTLTLVKGHIEQGNVILNVDLAGELPYISGIQGQLEDVWLNLLLNARDAVTHKDDPAIGIRTRYDPDRGAVAVTVWDNGIGIPAEQQTRIFEPFYTTKAAGEGTGLGLHICRQIVEKCHGSISLQSQYNQGTQFIIYLPVYHKRELA